MAFTHHVEAQFTLQVERNAVSDSVPTGESPFEEVVIRVLVPALEKEFGGEIREMVVRLIPFVLDQDEQAG